MWRACNLTSFTPCLTGPVDYPLASRHEGPGFKSPGGGTYVKPGFSAETDIDMDTDMDMDTTRIRTVTEHEHGQGLRLGHGQGYGHVCTVQQQI
jgi:hypothetical protein